MLTKTLVLPTDLFRRGFCPVEVVGLKTLWLSGLYWPRELPLVAGDEGKMGLDEDGFTTGTIGL